MPDDDLPDAGLEPEPDVESDAAVDADPNAEVDARPDAGPVPRPRSAERRKTSFWGELPFLIVIALVLALLIKTFLVQAFYIPSASMENTLQGGRPNCNDCGTSPGHPFDRVLVNKLVYDFRSPHRGEIVVFKGPPRWPNESSFTTPSNPVAKFFHDVGSVVGLAPASGSDFIKRVIAVGGDTVTCKDDVLKVNGHTLDEPYLYPGSHPCAGDNFDGQTRHVPQGDIFVMGDHRDNSEDSRVNGPVPVSDVVGRAFVVIWPPSDWKGLPIPFTFDQAGLGVGSSGNTLLVVAVLVLILVGITLLWVVRRRRRRRASYASTDG